VKPAPPARTRRVFFALWPGEREQQELAQCVAGALVLSAGRLLPARNLHATLAFLGAVPEDRLEELATLARLCAQSWTQTAPRLTFRRLEHWGRVDILVVTGQDEGERAGVLATSLKDAGARGGFAPDLKPFRAHVTVARKVTRATAPAALRAVVWEFSAFALVSSRTEAAGPVYSVIESYPLVKTQKARE